MIEKGKYIIGICLLIFSITACFRTIPATDSNLQDPKIEEKLIFNDYDFNSGDYELFGVYWSDFERNSLADSIGNFSIKDTVLLNQLKTNWKLSPYPEKKCGYDYKLYLTNGDSVVSTSFLNIHCESLLMDGVGYSFEREKLVKLYGKTDSIETIRVVFYSQEMAVDYLKSMRDDPAIFVLDNGGYIWEKYIGFFETTYTNEKVTSSIQALAEAKKEISEKYRTSDFQLESVGSNVSAGTYKIRVYCEAEFLEDFKLYPIYKGYSYIINYSMTGFKRL